MKQDTVETKLVGAQVDLNLLARIRGQARREDRDVAKLVRQALRQYLALALANANGEDTTKETK